MFKGKYALQYPSGSYVGVTPNDYPYPAVLPDQIIFWAKQKDAEDYRENHHVKAVAPNLKLVRIIGELPVEEVR